MKLLVGVVTALALLSIFHSQFSEAFNSSEDVALEMAQESMISLYKQWKAYYKPSNSAHEEIDYYRFYIWLENLKFVQNHNEAFSVSMNQFADLSNEEFMSIYLGSVQKTGANVKTVDIPANGVSQNVNWTAQGKVGQVLNQGQCGSCWSFSAAESLTSYTAIKNNTIIYYSEQELVDCSSTTQFGNEGCNGGVVQWAYEYVLKNGIESSTDYPYRGIQQKCKKNSSNTQYQPLTSYVEIGEGNCTQLSQAILQQPISIAIDASGLAFQLYAGGVYSKCKTNLNHAILLTGYNNDGSNNGYWLAENSWGSGWGENGYIQFALGNTCGLCNQATYPQ